MSRNLFQKLSISLIAIVQIFVSITCHNSELIIPTPKYQPPQDLRKIIPNNFRKSLSYLCTSHGIDTWSQDTIYYYLTDTIRIDNNLYLHGHGAYYTGDSTWKCVEKVDSNSYLQGILNMPAIASKNKKSVNSENDQFIFYQYWYRLKTPIVVGNRWPTWYTADRSISYSTIKNIDSNITLNGKNYRHAIMVVDSGYVSQLLTTGIRFIVPGVGIVLEESDLSDAILIN